MPINQFTAGGVKISQQQNQHDETLLLPRKSYTEQQILITKLYEYIVSNLLCEEKSCLVSIFQGIEAPPISLFDYITREVDYSNEIFKDSVTGSSSTGIRCALFATLYLDRLGFKITPKSIHRYFSTAFLVAMKFCEDIPISNKIWSGISGCSLQDVNRMELEFCFLIHWKVKLSVEDLYFQMGRFGASSMHLSF